jgi:hypothetical protein
MVGENLPKITQTRARAAYPFDAVILVFVSRNAYGNAFPRPDGGGPKERLGRTDRQGAPEDARVLSGLGRDSQPTTPMGRVSSAW